MGEVVLQTFKAFHFATDLGEPFHYFVSDTKYTKPETLILGHDMSLMNGNSFLMALLFKLIVQESMAMFMLKEFPTF